MYLYALSLLYEDTKFSPDLLYYIIDNQMIALVGQLLERTPPLLPVV